MVVSIKLLNHFYNVLLGSYQLLFLFLPNYLVQVVLNILLYYENLILMQFS